MNNADMPATPLTEDQIDRSERGNGYEGLTKREYFAGIAMQAYISGNTSWTDGLNGGSVQVLPEDAAKEAVYYADALLNELERTK